MGEAQGPNPRSAETPVVSDQLLGSGGTRVENLEPVPGRGTSPTAAAAARIPSELKLAGSPIAVLQRVYK
jgi:hypothetical protein